MKVKVCGLRDAGNIKAIGALNPDYAGFIFYEPSPRNVDEVPTIELPDEVKKVGVFVNSTIDFINLKNGDFQFDYIQLHGNESPEFCADLKAEGFKIIKAFSIYERFEFGVLDHYKPTCEFFLFDTKGENPGGNGLIFNWNLLNKYDNEIPFFLSGGLELQHVAQIKELTGYNIHGIDVNSRFEISPAIKDVAKVKELIKIITNEEL